MTLPSKPTAIRLSAETAKRFAELCAEFGGLPPAQVMRYVVESVLSQPLPAQVEIVTNQIRRPGKSAGKKPTAERLEGLNANRRHVRE